MIKIISLYELLIKQIETYLSPLYLLLIRLYLAYSFFISGFGRAKDLFNGSWDTQIFLFELEHPVPFLPASLAACITLVAEITLPLLLVAGLLTRVAALGILAMSAVIQLTYLQHEIHIIWMILSVNLIIFSGGSLSIDYLMSQKNHTDR